MDVESALAVKTGKLEDYDFSSSDNSVITQYSRHDLYLDKDISFGIRIGYDFHFGDFSLLPCAGFIYRNVKYSAQDGYLQYPESGVWDPDGEKTYVQGTLISYDQALYYPEARIELEWHFSERHTLTLLAAYGFNVSIDSVDSHYLRAVRFCDLIRGGNRYVIGLQITSQTVRSSNSRFLCGFEYSFMPLIRGTTASGVIGASDTGPQIDYGYGSGCSENMLKIILSLTY